jgi:hypothetical protein
MTTDNLIKWSAVAAVVAVAMVAGWVSFVHILTVVSAHGEHGALAFLYPATADGLIYSASMVMLDSARRGIPTPGLARVMLAAGIAVTLVANILAGVAFGVLGAVVAAWPALALVGSYELLMIMIRRARASAPEAVANAVTLSAPETVAETVAQAVPEAVPIPVPQAAAGTVARRARRRPANAHAKKAERVFARHLADGRVPSLRAVMAGLHVGQDRAREVRQHLATLATANGEAING